MRRRAERVRDELVRQVREGRQPRTNASLAQLVERHLAVSEVEPRTRLTLLGYLRKHVVPLIGDRPVGSVNGEVLKAFYAELRRCRDHRAGPAVLHHSQGEHGCDRRCRPHTCKPLAAWTIRKIHFLISSAYQSALRWEWISLHPMVRARKPAPPAADPQPPTAEEAAALLAECWRWDLGPFVWLAMTTGARRGELCASTSLRRMPVRHTQLIEINSYTENLTGPRTADPVNGMRGCSGGLCRAINIRSCSRLPRSCAGTRAK